MLHDNVQALLAKLREQRSRYSSETHSKVTVAGYNYDWTLYEKWCEGMGLVSLPSTPDTLSLYLTWVLTQGLKVTTANRRCSAVVFKHVKLGLRSPLTPDVRAVMSGAQRLTLEKPRQMRPLTVEHIRTLSQLLADEGDERAMRDRALLLIGFTSALRRSNLAALLVEDIEEVDRGLILSVEKEKNDQKGEGRLIGLPRGKRPNTCPVRVLNDWLGLRGRQHGPLFPRLNPKWRGLPMDGQCVHRIVQKRCKQIGLEPDDRWGCHSMRSGLITAAGEAGVSELVIAAQSGHRSTIMVRRYFRRSDLWKANACYALDL